MIYKYEFQYKHPEALRPEDGTIHEIVIRAERGEYIPCPVPGDSVDFGDVAYKVLTRHFSYLKDFCCVNIVVTDLTEDEMDARLKM
ncbi:hypothetical protein P4S93_09170 [Aneurinibacillus thermoaerophilus]|uniref:hypothetical protein n=1 Tax=Aneurinibacillus thermoaerophilus TaxID=143495 RepID=UPI002E1DA9BD|nr:hypothetical protein [Aneurinibacillus thermoaerophilus]MED0760948.1 hypothetical protein [Aneurinibacillus thermoaerophilus]